MIKQMKIHISLMIIQVYAVWKPEAAILCFCLLIFTKLNHEIKLLCFFTFSIFKNEMASPGFCNKEHKIYVNIMLVYFYIGF